MKLICDGPEHLDTNKSNCTPAIADDDDSNHFHHTHSKLSSLGGQQQPQSDYYICDQTEEDTEDEQKAPLLSINQRLSEIYVSSGGGAPLRSLNTWTSRDQSDNRTLAKYPALLRPKHKYSPFPCRRDINHRLSIWDGDIDVLEVEAVSIASNGETLRKQQQQQQQQQQQYPIQQQQQWTNESPPAEKWFRRALVALTDPGAAYCDSDEVHVTTSGFQLKAKYILHTISPVGQDKLRPATDAALFSCYRNLLTKAVDLGLKSIAICTNYTQQSNLKPDNKAHIALRTVRRFLEAYPDFRVVLCVERGEKALYNALVSLYYPISAAEEDIATWHLPLDIGGALGEPIDAERQIRIIQNPRHAAMSGADDDSDSSPHDLEGGNRDLEYGTVLLNLNNHQSFTQMQGDLDRQRLLGDRPRVGVYESVIEESLEGIEHQERYEKLLKRAQTEDLREVSGIGCLYQSGVDRLGRPVIIFCGKWFPAQNINLEKALLYLIYLLDPIVNGDYVISYFHTLTGSSNYPSLHWLKDVYTVLPYKYKKNLKAFYIVHPTIWTKMVTWWFTTFMAPAIKAKVHSLPGVEHLYSVISKDQLEIPAYITEYDMTVNGLHYFQPTGPTTS